MERLILCALCLIFPIVENMLITTKSGPVVGKFNDVDGEKYYSYEGIPYAKSPIGDLRFQPPVELEPWINVLNATTSTPVCHQEELLYTKSQMSEDCLYLNVYSPDVSPSTLKPVFVFVHGGYFIWGSGNREPMFGPEKVIANDAVAVTLNYRLGIFGFLSFGTKELPGNAGLKDVLLALKWISENVQQFGGDPTKITLAGVEAGAMLINYLMLTKKSEGYFQNVMFLTGNALSYRALQRNPKKIAMNLASKLGLKYENDNDLLQQLKSADAFQLTEVQTSMVYGAPDVAFVLNDQFMPNIEPITSSAIITSDPLEAMKEGWFPNLPVFMGFNTQDGLEVFPLINNENIKKYPDRINYLNENFDACIPRDILYPPGSQMRQDLANSIREFYFNNGNITLFNIQNYLNLITDTAYGYPADVCVQLLKQKPNSKVYFYLLDMDTDIYWFKVFHNITYPGASHFDSLFFNQPITKPRLARLDKNKQILLEDIGIHQYNFINYGDPSSSEGKKTSVQWRETGNEHAHMCFSETSQVITHPPFLERINFWRSVYDQYYQYVNKNHASIWHDNRI